MKKALTGIFLAGFVFAEPVFMDGEWAKEFCKVWNNTPELVEKLGKSESWTKVPERRVFLYRKDCGPGKVVQLTIKNENGKALCIYGGWKKDEKTREDFMMWADTQRWLEMGRGEYGPMKAMLLGRLSFEGPKGVAMNNMGPFEAFLKAIDNVKSNTTKCP